MRESFNMKQNILIYNDTDAEATVRLKVCANYLNFCESIYYVKKLTSAFTSIGFFLSLTNSTGNDNKEHWAYTTDTNVYKNLDVLLTNALT